MKPLLMLPYLVAIFICFIDIKPLYADASQPSKPVVLIVAQSRKGSEQTREKQFITQTMLALEQFRIVTVARHQQDFSELPFSKRLEVIRPLAQEHNAAATIWIEETNENRTLLHLVAFSTGRALVRIVEAHTGPDAALELSLAAQELLGQAYLLSEERSEAIENVVTKLTKDAVSTLKTPVGAVEPEERSYPAFSLTTFAATRGDIGDYAGNPFKLGGGVALEIWAAERLRIRSAVQFLSGLHRTDEYGTVYPFGLDIELGVGYLFNIKRFALGPALTVSALWDKLHVNLKTTGSHVFSWWSVSMAAALDMRFKISEKLSLLLEPALAVLPTKKQYYLRPELTTVYMTSRLGWRIKAGVNVFF